MENQELSLSEKVKSPERKFDSSLSVGRLATLAAIVTALSSCGPRTVVSNGSDAASDSNSAETAADSGTPVTQGSEKNSKPWSEYNKEQMEHCSSIPGKNNQVGSIYPFGLVTGSRYTAVDLCNPSGAVEVPVAKVAKEKDGFNHLYISTPNGGDNMCYDLKDGTKSQDPSIKNRTIADSNFQSDKLAYRSTYGGEVRVDGDKAYWVDGRLTPCPDSAPEANKNPGKTPRSFNTGSDKNADRAEKAADRAEAAEKQASHFAEEAKRNAALANDAREAAEKAIQRNYANTIPDAGTR